MVETAFVELFKLAMETDELPDEPVTEHGGDAPLPPVDNEEGDGRDPYDDRIVWAAYGFLAGAAYVYLLWVVYDWVSRNWRR